ncbi:sensor histidine kinase [Micromonospora yangpuensis]|uniref:histidine kinase n=1 Tax=Micromonospora yangpuensis TaxID=683228 RepID=A0A1C6U1J3_9ACTN|nr:histidine kinase [Micromonospora yangpuensis]GGM10840.1 two-component sensor histidine kinase [Micromonospora yangpuensis]SCL47960.1 Signal transduction histidine kinase [Micromonospora yangpuensis]
MTGTLPWHRRLPRDAVLLPAFGLLDLFTSSSVVIQHRPVSTTAWLLQLLAALVSVGALAWRHRAPVTVFVVECAHGVVVWFLLHDYRPWVALVVALYSVAVLRPLAVSAGAYAAACGRGLLNALDSYRIEPVVGARFGEFLVTALMFALVYGAAWSAGLVVRGHRARVRQFDTDRQAARDEAVTRERQRIAAELHDVVSHSVTVMVLQAAGAAQVATAEPERARQALLHIQQAGQQAMAELRRLLDVMTADADPAGGADRLGPQPRLADIEVLLASMRRTGLSVWTHTSGRAAPLDPSVELAAYRTVQESLTNTLKHAGAGSRVRIYFTWEEQVLLLRIDDDGPAASARPAVGLSAGHGLASLGERIRRAGGRLSTGPRPEGGFRVAAGLPISQHPVDG